MKPSVGKRGFTAKALRHLQKYFFFILTTIKRVICSFILQYKNYSNWEYFGKTNERGVLFNENIIETKSNKNNLLGSIKTDYLIIFTILKKR